MKTHCFGSRSCYGSPIYFYKPDTETRRADGGTGMEVMTADGIVWRNKAHVKIIKPD